MAFECRLFSPTGGSAKGISRVKLLFDEGLTAKLVSLLSVCSLGPKATFTMAWPAWAAVTWNTPSRSFVPISTDRDFEILSSKVAGAKVVILRRCYYPAEVTAEVLRRNAILIGVMFQSNEQLITLDR